MNPILVAFGVVGLAVAGVAVIGVADADDAGVALWGGERDDDDGAGGDDEARDEAHERDEARGSTPEAGGPRDKAHERDEARGSAHEEGEAVEGSAREAVEGSAREAVEGSARDAARGSVLDAAHDLAREADEPGHDGASRSVIGHEGSCGPAAGAFDGACARAEAGGCPRHAEGEREEEEGDDD